ncbi:MAG: sopA 7 [Herbaspirillum sp.]|jgi:hypothetical protein|nr:sopA 7 [Herbaspirillum sp.]
MFPLNPLMLAPCISNRCLARPPFSGTRTKSKILALMGDCCDPDSDIFRATLDFTKQLIALKHYFPRMLDEQCAERPAFDINEPLVDLHIDRKSFRQRLQAISASLTLEPVLSGIWDIVEDSDPATSKRIARQSSRVMEIDPGRTLLDWPVEAMLFVLRIGNWDKIDLRNANLINADLREVRWRDADLRKADLSHAQLAGADLTGCNLRGAILRGANMEEVIADRAIVADANLSAATARYASFCRAQFDRANLINTDFRSARLTHASGLACAPGTNFLNADLEGVQLSVAKAGIDPVTGIPSMFYRRDESRRLFREQQLIALASIVPRQSAVRNDAVWRLIEDGISDTARSVPLSAYARFLMTQEQCWIDQRLAAYIDACVLPALFESWNHRARNSAEPLLEHVLLYLDWAKPALPWQRYCGAVSQFLTDSDPLFPEQLAALQQRFLQHPGVAPVAAALEAVEEGLSLLCSIFIAPDGSQALAYENRVLQNILHQCATPYDGYQFEHDADGSFRNECLRNPYPIMQNCEMPMETYGIRPPPTTGSNVVAFIFGDPEGDAYKDKFLNALLCRSLASGDGSGAPHCISLADDVHLTAYFQRFLEGDFQLFFDREQKKIDFHLSTGHVDGLWKSFELDNRSLADTALNRARMLLCVGTLFVRYSSEYVFGVDVDSLSSLRMYALGCLNEAHALDPSILNAEIDYFGAVLRGIYRGQCSGSLSYHLTSLIENQTAADPALATCFDEIYPRAWR